MTLAQTEGEAKIVQAKAEGQADIERAKAAAEANRIIENLLKEMKPTFVMFGLRDFRTEMESGSTFQRKQVYQFLKQAKRVTDEVVSSKNVA